MRSIVKGTVLMLVGCAALRGAVAESIPTVYVPTDYATIQQAVDWVEPGTIISVAAGEYGFLSICSKSDLTIRGDRGANISNCTWPAIAIDASARIVVSGFTVASDDVGVSIVGGSDIVVENITVQSTGSDGIRVDSAANVTITGNRIESVGGTGINVVATSIEVSGPLTVTSNTVLSAVGDGILVHNSGDAAHMVIADNVVTDVGGRGIRSECGMTLQLLRNEIGRTGGSGISIHQVQDTATVSQNRITSAGGAGIEFQDAVHAVVSENSIDRSAGDGVTISGDDVRIDGNTISAAGDAGIRLEQWSEPGHDRIAVPGDPTISSNVVTAPAGTGIVLVHAWPLHLTGNTIGDPGIHGIVLDGSSGVRVSRNEVTGAGACGFRLENLARSNVLTKNTAVDCSPGFSAPGLAKKNRIARSNRFRRRSHR